MINRRVLGKTLTWLGILDWIPFILLTIGRNSPPILPFLAVHLMGILAGAWLKSTDSKEPKGKALAGRSPASRLGSVLIMIGIAVWLPYFAWMNSASVTVSLTPFLAIHLSAVIPGLLLRLGVLDRVRTEAFKSRRADEPTQSTD